MTASISSRGHLVLRGNGVGDRHAAAQAEVPRRPHQRGDLLGGVDAHRDGHPARAREERGELVGAVADDGHAEGLEHLEGAADVEDRLHAGRDDGHLGAGELGEVGRDVHRVLRALVHAAEAARDEHADAGEPRDAHRARDRRRAVHAGGDDVGQVADAHLADARRPSRAARARRRRARRWDARRARRWWPGTAPPSRTICSTSRAIATFCGYGIPWLMIVDSSATTGAPGGERLGDLRGDLEHRVRAWRVVLVIGELLGGGLGGGQVGRDEGGGEVGAHGVGRGAGEGGQHLAVAGGLDDVGAVEQGVHVAGGHRVAGAGDVGDLDRGGADEHGPRPRRPRRRPPTAGCRACRAAPTRARRRGRAARRPRPRTSSTVSATGWPTSAASSSTFGVTVCTRTDPSSTGAAAVALATLTGSNTERTPASWAAESSQRMTVASRLASTTRASAPPSRRRHDGEVGHRAARRWRACRPPRCAGRRCRRARRRRCRSGAATRRRAGTRPRRRWCAASTVSPAGSSPTAATSTVGRPSRARFSAMLRPTPPTVAEAVPGLLVPSTGATAGADLGVEHGAADDEHRVGLGAQRGSRGPARRPCG